MLVITYLSLVIGELIPKRLALRSPDRIASRVAAPMKRLSALTSPLVKLLEGSTNGLLRLFGLGDRTVSELMVPRPDVVFLDLDDPPEVIKEVVSSNRLSRYPVIQGMPDNIVGVVRAKDLLASEFTDQPFDLKAAIVPALYFPDTMPAFKAIEMFKSSRRHMAIVIDEHGGVEGVITINDILDALVGDIPSMDEQEELPVVRREDGTFLLDGALSVNRLKHTLQLKQLPGEEDGGFQTLGGFLMTRLGRVPAVADHVEVVGWGFEVMDMDRRRIDKVLVTQVSLLVLANGFFVASEFALVGVRRSRIQTLAKRGNRRAGLLLELIDSLNAYISATQFGITMASLALGWIGEPVFAHLLEAPLEGRVSDAVRHTLAFAIAFSVITFLPIVLGELAPKTLALERAEKVALAIALPMRLFYKAFYWPIRLLDWAGTRTVRMFGLRPSSEHASVYTEEELRRLIEVSRKSGNLEEEEQTLINRVFDFSDAEVREAMVPRVKVAALPVTATLEEAKQAFRTYGYPTLTAGEDRDSYGSLRQSALRPRGLRRKEGCLFTACLYKVLPYYDLSFLQHSEIR